VDNFNPMKFRLLTRAAYYENGAGSSAPLLWIDPEIKSKLTPIATDCSSN